jgi:putative oxidoreductase
VTRWAAYSRAAQQNGYELVLTLGAASLLFVAVGPGRYSLDHVLFGRRKAAATAASSARD